jgi:tetratricopeptide (TPR) repeat protein
MKNFIVSGILLFCLLAISFVSSQVKIWEEPLIIPTWEIGPSEKNAIFPWTFVNIRREKQTYPYPYKEILTNNKIDKSYNACWLENEFIKVLVTPEIGGKLYGAKDKTNNYNFFYWQPTVKPALIGMTGAWISGGIEWNFPTGHRPSSFSKVSHQLVENSDGSKTIWVGETELVYRMRWIVGITLHPNKSVIEAKVRLMNPTSLSHSYYMWATAATNTNEYYQAIYPTRMMTDHFKYEYYHWPVHDGLDISWWKNVPNATSFFSVELADFFGWYDHGKQTGTITTGDKHIIIGKKLWTWGTSPFGRLWDRILSDGEGPYVEPQAGAYADNQPDYHWLEPGEVKAFSYFYYPVRDIGPYKQANINGALNLEFNNDQIKIGAYSTGILNPGTISLTQNGKTIFKNELKIDPSKPFVHEIKIEGASKDKESYCLSMLDQNGIVLVSYTPQFKDKMSIPEPANQDYNDPVDITNNDELWHSGEMISKYRDLYRARIYFLEAIKRDPGDSRSHISLAELDIKGANYKSALEHLTIAESRDPDNGKLFYLRAVAEQALGDYESAYKHFYRSVHFHKYISRAYEHIAKLDLRFGHYEKACKHIDKAIEYNTLNAQLYALKATASRLNGNCNVAEKAFDHALTLDPIHSWALNEQRLVFKAQKKSMKTEKITLTKILVDNYQNYIELAIQYMNMGLYKPASQILELARPSSVNHLALINYYNGYCKYKLGKIQEAVRLFNSGMKESTDYIFPFRRETIEVLHTALQYNPQDAKAYYYMGMIYAGIIRGEKAISYWKKTVEIEPQNARAWRNIGLLLFDYPGVKADIQQAKECYEKAFQYAPQDSRILWELDMIKQRMGESSKNRLIFLQKHKKVVETRDGLLTAMLDLMVQNGQFKEALVYYQNHVFNNWEGRYTIHNSYLEACIGMAKAAKTPDQALQMYLKASEYPKNLKVAPRSPNLRGFLYYPMAQLYKEIGNSEEAVRLLKITANESTSLPTLVNYYKALASRDLNKTNSIDQIIIDLKIEAEKLIKGEAQGYLSHFDQKTDNFKQALGYYYLSKVHEFNGNISEADKILDKAVRLEPLIKRHALIYAQIKFAGARQ